MCASVFLDSSAQLALLLVNLLFFALPLRAKREERWQNRKEEEARDGRVMFPLLLCSFERRRVKKKSRGSCNRPRYVSAQMRRIRVLLFWVGPEETTWRSTRVFNVQFSYIMNLLASSCSESKSPAGKIKTNCLFVTSLILRSDTRADWYTDERWLDEWWFQRYCQKKKSLPIGLTRVSSGRHAHLRADRFPWKTGYVRYFVSSQSVSQPRRRRRFFKSRRRRRSSGFKRFVDYF